MDNLKLAEQGKNAAHNYYTPDNCNYNENSHEFLIWAESWYEQIKYNIAFTKQSKLHIPSQKYQAAFESYFSEKLSEKRFMTILSILKSRYIPHCG